MFQHGDTETRRHGRLSYFLKLCLCVSVSLCSNAYAQTRATNSAAPDYLNPRLPIKQRVEDLVSRITLEEKVSQMMNAAPAIPRLGVP